MIALLLFLVAINVTLARADLKVEEVQLYHKGATVIAKGVVYVHPGRNFIGFIPADAERESVRVASNCDAASITGMDLTDPEDTAEYKRLKDKLRILDAKLSRLKDQEAFYKRLIDALADSYRNNRYLNYLPYEKKYQELENRMLAVRQKKNQLIKEVKDTKEKLKKLESKRALYLWATGEDQCEVTVSYETDRAGWTPEYTAVFEKGTLTLTLRAVVMQSTGQNWERVSVSLSPHPPSRNLSIPELHPWYLRVVEPFMRMAPKAALSKAPVSKSFPILRRREIGYSYTLNQEVNIPQDRRTVLVIRKFTWKGAELKRLCYPSITDRVYAKVELPLPDEPLPSGMVKIFLENTYLGKSSLKSLLGRHILEIPFGTDPDIEVHSGTDIKRESTWSGKIRLLITRTIKVSNGKDRAVSILLKEPLPVSKDERIKVKMEKKNFHPEPDSVDERGIATWNLKVASGETKKISYTVIIEYPSETAVNIIY